MCGAQHTDRQRQSMHVARPTSPQIPLRALESDRAEALALTPVSRETAARLDRFIELLLKWQTTTQLISASTVPKLWTRHVADSLQLIDLAPHANTWADIGSGAGFPGRRSGPNRTSSA